MWIDLGIIVAFVGIIAYLIIVVCGEEHDIVGWD